MTVGEMGKLIAWLNNEADEARALAESDKDSTDGIFRNLYEKASVVGMIADILESLQVEI